ncbi:MAG TPA: hypothetical protein VF297_18295 [Pyrinomonadaceae bacterium]
MSTEIFALCNEPHDALLARVKANLRALEALQHEMAEAEAIGLLRFYNSDLRVYDLRLLVERAVNLFRAIAGDDGLVLPFEIIVQDATLGSLDLRSSRAWIMGASPVIAGFHHCKFLVDQHVRFGRVLERPPDSPPAGWAALLRLYRSQ